MENFKQKIIAKQLKQELSIKGGVVVIDEVSCDGCGTCVEACPHDAISMKTLSKEDVKKLPFKGRLKVFIKGKNKAFINTEICTSCSLCMKNCHEFAIHKIKK